MFWKIADGIVVRRDGTRQDNHYTRADYDAALKGAVEEYSNMDNPLQFDEGTLLLSI
jgi:hypothetical protein